ncbi:RICIN domain-containing protein [Phycicoccus flavus]|uniref:RICIN domain-containing protein n=1 Tax=Phycicoccus flavus TaxID=2502783 RepID=UPI000FEBF7FC|nr:RICIN domain-containing protein [Phycicoccus flavus]NHA66452.1 RICIN domain-containing protein [Phycicoccus flavus]
MRRTCLTRAAGAAALAATLAGGTVVAAWAYVPTPKVLYQLDGAEACLKGRGNCVIYPKTTELPSGRLVAAFEKSTVVGYPSPDTAGGAVGQTMPVWKSDDHGDSWQPLSQVRPPSQLSSDPAVAKFSSNWTNPYLYVMPETVGSLTKGTLVLASVVSGEDEYYREQKAQNPSWEPTNDGDRRNVSIALFRSNDSGASWSFVNMVAVGGWQGGSAGNIGSAISRANVSGQIDPLWEPHLLVHGGKLVAYYSDENDYSGYDTTTGVPTLAADNDTGHDSGAQILVHRTWDGTSPSWSAPVVDVAGDPFTDNGAPRIGGGRPGMTTVAPTTDGRWMMTFEYFGGGSSTRHKVAADPTRFFADGDPNGEPNSGFATTRGSGAMGGGGSPVLQSLPDGRLIYNASNSGSVWMNDGSSTGAWTEYQTTLGSGYSRNLQYVTATGRVEVLQATWGGASTQPVIRHADVDLGRSAGTYYRITNRRHNQVVGTGGNVTDANIGAGDRPDVRVEGAGSAPAATQQWHLTTKPGGGTTLLNRSGGRAASIWGGNAYGGASIGSWVDDTVTGQWTVVDLGTGYVKLRSTGDPNLYLTATRKSTGLSLQPATNDGSQEWRLDVTP